MKRSYFPYLILVFIITAIADWGIQMGYYFYTVSQNPQAFSGVRTLFDYQTGFIGDTVIVPLINVFILLTFISTNFRLRIKMLFPSALIGFLGDVFIHFMQGELKLTNWSMPRPFEWNFVSYWHMVSFFFQLTYIALFFILLFKHRDGRVKKGLLIFSVITVLILMVLFLAMFFHDYRRVLTL